MRHLNDEEEKGGAEEISSRTMVGSRDDTKLHKEMRADEVNDDDASTVTAKDSRDN
jgi:hypothetical protein